MDTSSPAWARPITTRVVRTADDGLVAAVDRLVAQISETGAMPGRWELNQMLANPGALLIVAEEQGTIVGMLALVVFRTPSGVRAKIDDLVVDEEAQGLEVRERLTRRALKTAASRGARTIQLECHTSNAAAGRLYEQLGFTRDESSAYQYKLSG